MKQFHKMYFKSKIGTLELTCDGEMILALSVADDKDVDKDPENSCMLCQKAFQQLQEYFAGSRTKFDLPISPIGSRLQTNVWNCLKEIPYGSTISYSEIASAAGCKSVRAVATAVGKNPLPIIIPCHRVIRKSGALGKFSLVGPEVKDFLLKLEQHRC